MAIYRIRLYIDSANHPVITNDWKSHGNSLVGPLWWWPCIVLYFIKKKLFLSYLNGLRNLFENLTKCASSQTKFDHPLLQMTQKRFRAAAMLVVFTVSAVVHEYVLAICFGFFYPVLFCLFMCFGSKNLIYYKSMANIPAEKKKKNPDSLSRFKLPKLVFSWSAAGLPKTIQTDQFNQLGQAGVPDNHLEIGLSFS